MKSISIHLIANAHLDPVWLWDSREGLNEGISTCRAIADLMDEFPELTFIRGEAAIYEHIEREDPALFERIRALIKARRWDVVGGTYIQPDMNLPATEVLLRQFDRGLSYFRKALGQRPTVAWAADCFGHSAGLPNILAAAGMESLVFCRPQQTHCPLDDTTFWWESDSGARIFCYRSISGAYQNEREDMARCLDQTVALSAKSQRRHHICFYGLGNHGGGPSREHLLAIRKWTAAHPEVKVIHSGLHRFIQAAKKEIQESGIPAPIHRGELNFVLRGCYSSLAKLKFAYRRAEARFFDAERASVVASIIAKQPPQLLSVPLDSLLFNSFHDILPGSSIERACDEQLEDLGGCLAATQRARFDSINALARYADTTVPTPPHNHPARVPFLVWNPLPFDYKGHVELEACLDHRPLWSYQHRTNEVPLAVSGPDGKALPFQIVEHEHQSLLPLGLTWRKRVVVPVTLPAMGWSVLTLGWVEGAKQPTGPAVILPLKVKPSHLAIWDDIKLSAEIVEDRWGSWGGMTEEPDSLHLTKVRETFRVTQTEVLETGRECAELWIRMEAAQSRIEFRVRQYRGRRALDFGARVLWNERAARLKLKFAHPSLGKEAVCEVPGGTVRRKPCGEMPGGRWLWSGDLGFASDALYNFDLTKGCLGATICRATRYATDVEAGPDDLRWMPAMDAGELKFRFLLTQQRSRLAALAEELEMPPTAQVVPAISGDGPRTGSLLRANPRLVKLCSLRLDDDGESVIVRLQSLSNRTTTLAVEWLGKQIQLGEIKPGAIQTWRIGTNIPSAILPCVTNERGSM